MINSGKRLIVIVGPTAVGKTRLAIEMAQKLQTEVISADSRQFYKEMSIGTAKPSLTELASVNHHFINSHSIHQPISAGEYAEEALSLINTLFEKYDNVIICGGSGLYIKGVCEGFDEIPKIDEEIRNALNQEFEAKGLTWLQSKTKELDPDFFEKVDQSNPMRLLRALEIKIGTGLSILSFQMNNKRSHHFEIIKIGLDSDRNDLYKKIDDRMDEMVENGLFDEAKQLYPYRSLTALQTVGYQEIFGYFDKEYDYDETVRLLKRNSRRYAKRQLTWFTRDNSVKWFKPNHLDQIMAYIRENN